MKSKSYSSFALSYQHTWQEPPTVFVNSAIEKQMNYMIPGLGQLVEVSSDIQEQWWNAFR